MMRTIVILGAATALLGGPALAQSVFNPSVTTVCLDVSGRQLPVTCHAQASRIDQREDICQCLRGGTQVIIPVCPAHVRAPAESAAYERDRYALVRNGSLVGANWQGRPVCVEGRDSLTGR